MSTIEVKVPDIGDFASVEVIEILVAVGDSIKTDQSLITLESGKAVMEIPSPAAGVVKAIKVKVGDKVAPDSVILLLDAAATQTAAPVAEKPSESAKPAAPAAQKTVAEVKAAAPVAPTPAPQPITQPTVDPAAAR